MAPKLLLSYFSLNIVRIELLFSIPLKPLTKVA